MVIAEYKDTAVTVRIHDEYIDDQVERRLAEMGRIISTSYRRRQVCPAPPAAAAFQSTQEGADALL